MDNRCAARKESKALAILCVLLWHYEETTTQSSFHRAVG